MKNSRGRGIEKRPLQTIAGMSDDYCLNTFNSRVPKISNMLNK